MKYDIRPPEFILIMETEEDAETSADLSHLTDCPTYDEIWLNEKF